MQIRQEYKFSAAGQLTPSVFPIFRAKAFSRIYTSWYTLFKDTRFIHLTYKIFRRFITSEREARSEFLLIYTKNLSMSGRPAVVTLLRGLYLWNRKPD